MTISPDLEAQILRYYHVERWRPGTIARQLHLHHGTVARVLAQAGLPRIALPARPSRIDPYLPFILATLEKFPTLTASRLYAMVRERGYCGGPDHFRHVISCHRPRPIAEAYLRLRTLPGEQAQVDWGHFGRYTIGRARRPLMAFVMVLSLYEASRVNNFLSFFRFKRGRASRECSSALMAWATPLLGRAERSTPQSPQGRAARREGLTAKARAERTMMSGHYAATVRSC